MSRAPRVLLIALDACDISIVRTMVDQGDLPAFRDLLIEASTHEVINPPGVFEGSLWAVNRSLQRQLRFLADLTRSSLQPSCDPECSANCNPTLVRRRHMVVVFATTRARPADESVLPCRARG